MLFKAYRQRRAIADAEELEANLRKLKAFIEDPPDDIMRRMEEEHATLPRPEGYSPFRVGCGPCHGIRNERRRMPQSAFLAVLLFVAGVSLIGSLLLAIMG